jgi:3-deoxy-manno-octulosonate cytidylyltransferase (CMP-KDO synthetase)
MSVLILIPARMASTRLPGKPLADIAGAPMIVHVARRAAESGMGRVVVATDTAAVADAVARHGFEAVMTRADHQSGSDRIHEALATLDPAGKVETIINVQGDLPTIEPETVVASAAPLADPQVDIATLGVEIVRDEEKTNPNVVKIVG